MIAALEQDQRDTNRALRIERNRPRGGESTAPKSGRARTVAMSRRLREALIWLHRSEQPSADDLVLAGIDQSNFRKREWRRILDRAGIGDRKLKDLRDTFASQLITAGIQLGYVSKQLGHADLQVTAQHYARWCGGTSTARRYAYRAAKCLPTCSRGSKIAPSLTPLTTTAVSGIQPTHRRH